MKLWLTVILALSFVCICSERRQVIAGPLLGPGMDDFDREVGSIERADRTLEYEFFRPPGYMESEPLPLVLYLHGFSDGDPRKQERLNDTMRGLVHSTQRDNAYRISSNPTLAAEYDEQFAAYLLVPKIPVLRGWSDHRDLVRQLMDQLEADYPIDPRKIYITGFSDGGFATIDMIEESPGVFAAGVPISGGGSVRSTNIERLAQVPLWFFHGTDDFTVPRSNSVDLYNAIVDAGGDARLSLPFGGHNAGYHAAFTDRNRQFYPWLFSQSLPIPEPSSVSVVVASMIAFLCGRFR